MNLVLPEENKLISMPIKFIPLRHESYPRIVAEMMHENLRPDTPLEGDTTPRTRHEHLIVGHDDLAQFDHFYTAFSAEKMLSEQLTHRNTVEIYLKPAMMTFSRAINIMSPNCEKVLSAPCDDERLGRTHTSLIHAECKNMYISSNMEQSSSGEWLVVVNMMIAFQWKRHYDTEWLEKRAA